MTPEMERLRHAILDVLDDDISMVGGPVSSTEVLIEAWNDLPDIDPINLSNLQEG